MISLLPEIAIFVHVVETESFSKTASILGVSPSSISRSISRLEDAWKVKLFERTTRKMRTTNKGTEIYQICSSIVANARLATDAAQSHKNEINGTLRVAAPKALSRQVLMPIVLDFIEQNPNVKFQLKVTDSFLDPIRDDVDILIHITDTPVESLVGRTLAKCKLVMCASPDYLNKYGVPNTPQDLKGHNCLCLGEDIKDSYWKFTRNDQQHCISVNGSLQVNHSEIRREAVLRGVGISIFPEFSIREYIENGQAVELLTAWQVKGNYQGNIIAQYPQSKYIPVQVRCFLDFLAQNLKLN